MGAGPLLPSPHGLRARTGKPQSSPRAASPVLSPEEAELAQRLSQAMRRKPHRPRPDPIPSAASPLADEPDVTVVIPHIDPDPFDDDGPSALLPAFADDPEPQPGGATVRTIKWLHRSRRNRLRHRLKAAAAWLVTIAVIGSTIGAASVALIGLEKSVALIHIADGKTTAALAAIEATLTQLRVRF